MDPHPPIITPQPSFTPITDIHIQLPIPKATENVHSMRTRSKARITKPKVFFAQSTDSSELVSVKQTLASPKWHKAIQKEFIALIRNKN